MGHYSQICLGGAARGLRGGSPFDIGKAHAPVTSGRVEPARDRCPRSVPTPLAPDPYFPLRGRFSREWNGSGLGGPLNVAGWLAPAMAGASSPVPCLQFLSAGGSAGSFRNRPSAFRIDCPDSRVPRFPRSSLSPLPVVGCTLSPSPDGGGLGRSHRRFSFEGRSLSLLRMHLARWPQPRRLGVGGI